MTEETQLAHYTCTRCNIGPIDVAVPVRINGTGVLDWLLKVAYPVAMADHLERSPKCEQVLDIGLRPPDYQPEIVQ